MVQAAGEPSAANTATAALAPAALPGAMPAPGTLAGPAAVLLLLAAAALLLSRRRRSPARRVQVLETTSLGPKRSLVLARLGDELLLLGTSEAGITLLRSQPAAAGATTSPPALAMAPAPAPTPPPQRELAGSLVDLAARLMPGRRRADGQRTTLTAATFDSVLAESAEDQELRRKLARGLAGSVR
jgi:flagellar biogenesis protein FliO